MKSAQKKRRPLPFLLAITFLPILFFSCEPSTFDVRDHIVGDYDYELQAFLDNGHDLEYIGDQEGLYDVTGTCQILKHPNYHDVIQIWDDGELLFEGQNIRETDNSIVFDIATQEYWLGTIPVTVVGINYWEVESDIYHGAYLYRGETVEIAMAADVMDVASDLVLILNAYKR